MVPVCSQNCICLQQECYIQNRKELVWDIHSSFILFLIMLFWTLGMFLLCNANKFDKNILFTLTKMQSPRSTHYIPFWEQIQIKLVLSLMFFHEVGGITVIFCVMHSWTWNVAAALKTHPNQSASNNSVFTEFLFLLTTSLMIRIPNDWLLGTGVIFRIRFISGSKSVRLLQNGN